MFAHSLFVLFFISVHCNVEHVISNILYNHLHSDGYSAEDFILKIYDKSEYLLK